MFHESFPIDQAAAVAASTAAAGVWGFESLDPG
jgi:hypothetical protein